jgi:aminoglycoside phosphotransferase (APT) family kinase protein
MDKSVRLRDSHDRTLMCAAARWLARFHRASESRLSLASLPCLHRYDAGHYLGWADRTSQLAGPLHQRFPWLATLCERFEDVVGMLLKPPAMIIHGEYYPNNILFRQGMIYPVDWESTTIAIGEIDFASLIERWPPEIIERCKAEYLSARWSEGPPAGFEQRLDVAKLYWRFRWLGRMQGFFTQHPEILNSCDFLIRQDSMSFRSKAKQALWNAAQISPSLARRLSTIVADYEEAIELLESQPLSLVYGGYIPWHILVDVKHKPARVCAVDWESVAFGPTLYDVAYFTYGMEAQSRVRVVDAYRRAAIQHRVPTPDETQTLFIVDCPSLHRVFD